MSDTVLAIAGRRQKYSPIGVDLGQTGVRAAQLIVKDGVYSVVHLGRCVDRRFRRNGSINSDRSAGADQSDERDDAEPSAATAGALERCLRQSAFRGRRAVAALDSPEVEFYSLELPDAVLADGASDAVEVVRWEVQRLRTNAENEAEISHWKLPPPRASGPNAIGVAASRETVARALSACEQAGLLCSCVDTAATALCRLGSLLRKPKPEEVWGLLDLGARRSRLILCVDKVPVLVRAAGIGGRGWTERIAESLQISIAAAEVQKRDHGIARAGAGRRTAPAGTDASQHTTDMRGEHAGAVSTAARAELSSILLGCLRSDLKELASEVKRSYEYALSCYPPRRAADLILMGGGAAMRNLPEFLGDALGISVRRASEYTGEPSSRLCREGTGAQLAATGGTLDEFALAIGLAIGH